MLNTTIEIIRSCLKADSTISTAERARLLSLLRQPESPKPENATPAIRRVLSRAEVAKRLSRSLRFVDQLAKDGILKKIKMPNRRRAIGFQESEVERLISQNYE